MKKIVTAFLLIPLFVSNLSIGTLYAKQDRNNITIENSRKDHVLKDAFSGKKLERIKASIKGKNNYRLLIRSSDGLDAINSFFDSEDKKIKVKKVGDTIYIIQFPLNTRSFLGELLKIDNGIIPSKIGSYDVVQPEIVEALETGYLTGETLDKLWNMEKAWVPSFAEELATKEKIKVGVLDTGIDSSHTDLANNYNTPLSYDFVNDLTGGIDDNGHGTEIAGIIGAEVNGKWVFGSYPNANLVSLKVLDQDGLGTTYDVLDAIAYAKTNHISVLNISFGGTGNPLNNPVCEAIADAKNNGTITVVSAGNANKEVADTIPAACPDAITVGATNADNTKASFSNYGNLVDVYAPGSDIYTTGLNNGYTTKNGTSFSAPLVTGLVAKELAYSGSIPYDQLLSNITNSYRLVTNGTLGNVSSEGFSNTGTTSTGSSFSGSLQAPVPVDYSTYHYYSGSFVQNGVTYGNSLYPDSLGFQDLKPDNVQIYSYDEYITLTQTKQGTFQALSVPTNGLAGEWKLDGNANDTSGNGNNGTATSVAYGTAKFGQAGIFASNSYIDLWGTKFNYGKNDNFTISAWWKTSNATNNWFFSNEEDNPFKGFWVGIGWQGWNAYFNVTLINNYASSRYDFRTSTTWNDNAWHNFVVVYPASTTNAQLYVDWVLQSKVVTTDTLGSNDFSSTRSAYLGARRYDTTQAFNGLIDNFRIYNRALSSTEIQDLYTESIGTWLIGKWDLNGNTNDTSGNGNNGSASNMAWESTSFRWQAQSASFNGNSYISAPGLNDWLVWTNKLTVGAWVYPTSTSFRIISANRQQSWGYHVDYALAKDENWRLSFWVYWANTTWWVGVSSVSTLPQNTWSYITCLYDGSKIKVYINGTFEAEANQSVYFWTTAWSSLMIWRNTPVASYQDWVGNIQWYRAYNRALSSTEIQDIYNEWLVSNNTSSTTPLSPTNQVLSNPTFKYDFTETTSKIFLQNLQVQSNQATIQKEDANKGDPITLSKGEFTYDNTLMSIPGKKIPFEFKLSYKNQLYYNGPTGINWDHNYNMYLTGETNGNVLYYNGKLGVFRFTASGSTFNYNEGLKANLVLSGSTYVINYDNGDKYTFNSTYNKVSKIEDINGNNLNFAYSGGLLSTVTDTLGRNVSYSYYDHNRLKDVTDFNGRKVTMNYFAGSTASGSIYDLENITINNGTGATKTIGFEYTTGGTDTTNHAITKLIDSKWQTYVENIYDTGSRVTSQKYGSGTLTYAYTLSGSSITKNTVIDKLGNKTEYTYDANGNQTQVKYYNPAQTSSVIYSYVYDSNGYMTKETKPRGNGFTYTYDGKGNMTEKRMKADTSAANSGNDLVTSYTYDSKNNLLSQTNPNGIAIVNTYDTSNNLLSKTLSGATTYSGAVQNSTTTYAYLSGFLDTATDGEGNITKFQYSSWQVSKIIRGTGSVTSTGSFVYDSYGNPTSSTDGEGWTKYASYNLFNLLSTGTTAEGIVTAYEYDANNNKTKETRYLSGGTTIKSQFFYDILDHMTGSLVDTASGKTLLTTFKYDENGNVIEKKVGSGALVKYTYNEFGKVTSERIIMNPGNSSEDIVTGYSYDTNGNLASKTDPLGKIYAYTYDLYDRATVETNPKGTYTVFAYNKDGGVSTKSIYDSGSTILSKSAYLYDGLGNIVKSTDYLDPANSTGWVETKIIYDRNGKKLSIIDPKGNATQNTYDSLGRLSSTTDALENIVSYAYDKRDLTTSKTITPNIGTGTVTTASAYDHDGRLTGEADNLSQTKTLIYNALNQVISSKDEANNITNYERNYLGKTTKETKYLSGGIAVTTIYTYDERGNLTSITDPENHTTTYAYDGINRNTSVTYPDEKQLVYAYDKNSNVVSQTDPNGTVVTNSYDTTNLLAGRSISTGTGVIGITSESYAYDSLGRAISGTDSNGNTLAFAYDSLGRLASENNSWTTVGYGYDANGNRTSISSGTGYLTNYSYDALNRLANAFYNSGNIASYAYSGILNTDISYGNGVNTIQTFDGLLRLSSLRIEWNNPEQTILAPFLYTYNPASNITSDGQKNYTYDTIYRLTQVNSAQSGTLLESFNYDKTGNRNSNVLGSLSIAYSGNILNQYLSVTQSGSASGSVTYSYDNNGNVVSNGVFSFSYDYKNRLVKAKKVSDNSTVVQYAYDVLGRRIQKLTSITKTEYVYAGDNAISETATNLSTSTKVITNRIFGIGTDSMLAYETDDTVLPDTLQPENLFCLNRVLPYIADFELYGWTSLTSRCGNLQSQYTTSVRKMFYVQKDHLWSTIWLTDSSGSLIQSYKYDVYGSVYVSSGSGFVAMKDFNGNLHGNTRFFTGREYDGEIGLYYLRARYYDPVNGRFVSRDPIGQVDNLNLYVYVQGDPLGFVDLMGLNSKPAIMTIYADRDDGWYLKGHAWIELTYKWETHSYWMYPLEYMETDRELKWKATGHYKNFISWSIGITKEDYVHIMSDIDHDLKKKESDNWYSDSLWVNDPWINSGFCTGWAISRWNSVASESDKMDIWTVRPNKLADDMVKMSKNTK